MGYDLHIVRTREWYEADSEPVTWEQVDALIAKDHELRWAKSATFTGGEPESVITVKADFIEWKGVPWFHWHENQVIGGSRDEAAMIKLAQMAEALSARLVGDDGEEYKLKRNLFGKLSLKMIPE